MEYISLTTFCWMVGIFLGIIISLIGFIAKHVITQNKILNDQLAGDIDSLSQENKEKIKLIVDDQKDITDAMSEIKNNYLSRFEKLHQLINRGNLDTAQLINNSNKDTTKLITDIRLEFIKYTNK